MPDLRARLTALVETWRNTEKGQGIIAAVRKRCADDLAALLREPPEADWPADWTPSDPPPELQAAGESASLAEYDEMLACIAAILDRHRLNGGTHAEMLRWKLRTLHEPARAAAPEDGATP